MLWGSKLAVTLTNPYLHVPHPPFSPYLLPCAWTKKKRWVKAGEDEKRKKEIGRNTKVLKVLPFLPFSRGIQSLRSVVKQSENDLI
jgi:hypothetical protein